MSRIIALWLLLVTPALAQPANIEVHEAWARAAPAGGTTAVFLVIVARAGADRLIRVESPVAGAAEVHETTHAQGVMRMRPVESLPVAPDDPARLAPGGAHIMLMRLREALSEGDHIPVRLTFERAGTISVSAEVTKPGGHRPSALGAWPHAGAAPK